MSVTNDESTLIQHLRDENSRLKELLRVHGIPWEPPRASAPDQTPTRQLPAIVNRSTEEKIALFRRLFRGRSDVYPVRWESRNGKSGYPPACANEWKAGLCQKPRVKCGDCQHRTYLPVTDQVVYGHLAGNQTIGVFPLLVDETCYFLAVDFDEEDWRSDAQAFLSSCHEVGVPAVLEISRSGKGAHAWIFFSEAVPARDARRLGAALISHTCMRTRQLSLSSYDRFFPNQDTLPKGGFGNLIALPLQKRPRESDCSVFVDENLVPFADQWSFLAAVTPLPKSNLEAVIFKATDGRNPLDVAFIAEEDEKEPWKRTAPSHKLPSPLPEELTLVLANQIFIAKDVLTQPLLNRLIRIAAFQNPEFYKAQAMRLPTWNKPRIIGCAENFPRHIGLPRGCLQAVRDLFDQNGIAIKLQDERLTGKKIAVKFSGELRKDQKAALKDLLKEDAGIFCAPTAFGKTVTAAALIASRKVRTLILVHRTELLRQWKERLTTFLDSAKGDIGVIGGGKNKPTGKIDIAVMQTLSRVENLGELLDGYEQVIIDECHHLSAFSFEQILKQAKAKYVLGLTATPFRRDGHQPILFMQCGPIIHNAVRAETAPSCQTVWPRFLPTPAMPGNAEIHDVFRILAHDAGRNRGICQDIQTLYRQGRKVLVLTERTDHIELLKSILPADVEGCFVLHGRLTKKERSNILSTLEGLDATTPRIILATGRLIGEGFDHPALDTLILAMPISWKGTLQQYAGRLHRAHAGKEDIRVYDYVERDHAQLSRMWEKRLRGYRSMGYEVMGEESGSLMP